MLMCFFSVEMGESPLVKTAASLFRKYCYKDRESSIAGIICAGWDKRNGGQVCSVCVRESQRKEIRNEILFFYCINTPVNCFRACNLLFRKDL